MLSFFLPFHLFFIKLIPLFLISLLKKGFIVYYYFKQGKQQSVFLFYLLFFLHFSPFKKYLYNKKIIPLIPNK